MLQVKIHKSTHIDNQFLSTRKIEISDETTVLMQIVFQDKKLGSVIENTIIDFILANSDIIKNDIYSNFGYLLEKLNKYLKETAKGSDISNLSIFIGLVQSDTLHFSILKNSFVYLIKDGKVQSIAEGMGTEEKIPQFSYISSGTVNPSDAICISNTNLLDYFTKEDLCEISKSGIQTIESSPNITENLLNKEIPSISTDMILVTNGEKTSSASQIPWDTAKIKEVFSSIKNFWQSSLKKAVELPYVKKNIEEIRKYVNLNNRFVRSWLFGIGIVVCISFLYLILTSLFVQKVNMIVPEELKNKLIEAQLIIEKANKDLGNRQVFNENIKKAEDILFEVRNNKYFLTDVTRLFSDISILKKQMNGVESFDPKVSDSEYIFEENAFALNTIFEINKRLYFLGKTSLIGPYIKGWEVKKYPYPDGEEAISADATTEGYIYVFTKTWRLLQFYKGEFTYTNVEGQKTWEKGKDIKFFNSNLYILGDDGKQIYKHKPWVNGFSSKTEVIDQNDVKHHSILSFGIDGGFYILKEDLTIDKIFWFPSYSKKSIIINGLPEDYAISGTEAPRFFIAQNLNYLYLLLNDRIWVFEPDSRNYKDVTALRYVGQIEFIAGKVRAIAVPKDGAIIAGTDAGIYRVNFEVSDGKIIIR